MGFFNLSTVTIFNMDVELWVARFNAVKRQHAIRSHIDRRMGLDNLKPKWEIYGQLHSLLGGAFSRVCGGSSSAASNQLLSSLVYILPKLELEEHPKPCITTENCPKAFHTDCLGMFDLPDVMLCDQCEKEFHVTYLCVHAMAYLRALPEGEWIWVDGDCSVGDAPNQSSHRCIQASHPCGQSVRFGNVDAPFWAPLACAQVSHEESTLFMTFILMIILYGKESALEEEMVKATKIANAHRSLVVYATIMR
eukprot:Gb_20385 [translate_table: standard]